MTIQRSVRRLGRPLHRLHIPDPRGQGGSRQFGQGLRAQGGPTDQHNMDPDRAQPGPDRHTGPGVGLGQLPLRLREGSPGHRQQDQDTDIEEPVHDHNSDQRANRHLYRAPAVLHGVPLRPRDRRARVRRQRVQDTVADWAKTFASVGALWVGNTGFGYGDTSTMAYSAKLMAGFADNLDGTMSVGAAFVNAKQTYDAGDAVLSPYDLKSLMESTFYGLPMYHLNSAPAPAAHSAAHRQPSHRPRHPHRPGHRAHGVDDHIQPSSGDNSWPARQEGGHRRQLLPGERHKPLRRLDPDNRVPPDRAPGQGRGHPAHS